MHDDVPIPERLRTVQSATASPAHDSPRDITDDFSDDSLYAPPTPVNRSPTPPLPPAVDSSPTTSGTASSATATVPNPTSPVLRSPPPPAPTSPQWVQAFPRDKSPASGFSPDPYGRPPLRIRGAKRAVLLPAELALLPAEPLWRRTVASIPVVGWIFSGSGELIGGSVPRKEDGTFDKDRASIWWRFWYSVDGITGWDTCGLRGGLED
jgi:hypothetical protein